MKAWQLHQITNLDNEPNPLRLDEVPVPEPAEREVVIRIICCAVCHTELDEIEGRTPPPRFPVIPGHQVIGRVERSGAGATRFSKSDRVGVAWIFSACGRCKYCRTGRENLCPDFKATGRDRNGGYAEYMCVPEAFAFPVPDELSDTEAAPLLCAGAIGYRSLMLTELVNGDILGLMGFGASGHLVLKMARHLFPQSKVHVFARSPEERAFALRLGAAWAGDVEATPPEVAHAIIDTTPAWNPILASLKSLAPGGRLVINAIRKEERDLESLLGIRYPEHLWMEKEVKSVANITRKDVEEFLAVAARFGMKPEVEMYPFEKANRALHDLKTKHVRGAKVLVLQ